MAQKLADAAGWEIKFLHEPRTIAVAALIKRQLDAETLTVEVLRQVRGLTRKAPGRPIDFWFPVCPNSLPTTSTVSARRTEVPSAVGYAESMVGEPASTSCDTYVASAIRAAS